MKEYVVIFSHATLSDYTAISRYLPTVLSEAGAMRYADAMRREIMTIGMFADCMQRSTSATARAIHPQARRMVSHNRRWVYVFHLEGDYAIVDRILPVRVMK